MKTLYWTNLNESHHDDVADDVEPLDIYVPCPAGCKDAHVEMIDYQAKKYRCTSGTGHEMPAAFCQVVRDKLVVTRWRTRS